MVAGLPLRRVVGPVLSAVLLAALLVAVPLASPARADTVTVTKEAPAEVLVGEPIRFTIRASSPAANTLPSYNGSLRDVLPPGVTYVPGSAEPASAGDPQVVTNDVEIAPGVVVPQQTLLWINLGDLQPGGDFSLSFRAQPVADSFPVGSTVTNEAGGYSSLDPRQVPGFDAQGRPIAEDGIIEGLAPPTTTTVSAIEVVKREPSPEAELLRGVHRNPTVYSLRVRNNTLAATEAVTLVDYVPAGLEYLGCGGVDNTPGGAVEYPGAPGLAGTPTPPDCVEPDTVETVENPTGPGVPTNLTGVFTRLTWTLGDLEPGADLTIRYAAGVPLRANTLAFDSGSTPTPQSLAQTANLDNNNGASTRETTAEQSLTNTARVTGTYTGLLAPGTSPEVGNTDTTTVTAEDLAMVKSVAPTSFRQGGIATYTLTLRAGEYTDADSIAITDVMPNGVCPLSSSDNFVAGAPADCAPVAGSDPVGADFADVVQNPDGTFTLRFTDIQIDANGTATVTYQGRMRAVYTGGDLAGDPTAAGDSFTNNASLGALTTPIVTDPPGGTGETGPQDVGDTSSATQTTGGPSVNKTALARTIPYECANGPYVESTFPDPEFVFRKGDRVCFQLELIGPANTSVRNPVVTDFLPRGMSYEAGSATVVGDPGFDVVFNESAAANGTENPTWLVGDASPLTGDRYVPAGSTLTLRLSAVVDRAAPPGDVDITGNLLKVSAEDSSGATRSLRDELPLGIAPAPQVDVLKGVQSVQPAGTGTVQTLDPTPPGQPGTNTDGVEVRQTDLVTYRVDLSNTGDPDSANDVSINAWQVWDVLPPGITCDDVVPASISPTGVLAGTDPPQPNPASAAGQCTDPGDGGHPTFAERDTQSAITWQASRGIAADPTDADPPGDGSRIATGDTRTLTYTVRIPDEVSVATSFSNTAHVRSFSAFANEFDVTTQYLPADNVDTTVDPIDANADPASDPSEVVLPDTELSKEVVATGVVESNNNNTDNGDDPAERGQATNGETVTFRIGVTVPARTTVYAGALAESLPATLTFEAVTAAFSPTGESPASEALPAGFVLDDTTGAVSFPAVYNNDTNSDQLVEVAVVARVTTTAGGHNSLQRNTATFDRRTAAGQALPRLSDTAQTRVVIPNPTITKSNDATASVQAGDIVVFTLEVTNANRRPPLHDGVVVDCVPDGLDFVEFRSDPTPGTATTAAGDGANGCEVDETRIEWVLGGPVEARDRVTLEYAVEVDRTAAGGVTYTNRADLTGSTIRDGANNPTTERVITDDATSRVGVGVPLIGKTVQPESLTFGERATFTVVAEFPEDINYYDSAIVDVLPDGFDPSTVELLTDQTQCTRPDAAPCVGGPLTALTSVPGPGEATRIGLSFGDVLATDQPQTLTLVYTALLSNDTASADVSRGDRLTNSATIGWNVVNGDNPTSADATFDRSTLPARATTTVEEPEVSVAKAVSTDEPGPAEPFSYTVTVTNSDDELVSAAHDITVVDDVPVGVVVTGVDDGGTYVPADPVANGGGTITWTIPGPLAPGDSIELTYQAVLAPSPTLDATSLTNTVVVDDYASVPQGTDGRRPYPDRDPTAQATVTPQFPALRVEKTTPDGEQAFIGDPFRWQIDVTNTGTAPALDVRLVDTLPPNWVYVDGSLVFTLGGAVLPASPDVTVDTDTDGNETTTLSSTRSLTLEPGQTLTAVFRAVPVDRDPATVVTAPGVGSDVAHTNTVDVTATDASGASGNADGDYTGTDTAIARIDSADLAVEKTPDPGAPVAGRPFTWTLTVSNLGPDDATGFVTVTDRLPTDPGAPDTDPIFVSAVGDGWACRYAPDDREVTCDRDMGTPDGPQRPFPAGTSETVDVTVRIPADVADGTTYLNGADVAGRTYDPDLSNNDDDASATVATEADLAIVKRLSGDLIAGEVATYTLDVRNDGPSTARADVVVTDALPPGTTFVSAEGAGWTCEEAAPGVRCVLDGDLPAGQPAGQITLRVEIPSGQTADVVNTADVESTTTPDPNSDNNTSTVTSPVTTVADLALEKASVQPPPFTAGQNPATYRFTVLNAGPSDATGPLTLTDTLPLGLTLVGVAGPADGWSCVADPLDADGRQPVECTRAAGLADRASTTFDLQVAIDPSLGVDLPPDAALEVRNEATVTSPTDDPDPTNNSDDDLTTSPREADLAIAKAHGGNPVVAGDEVTFTIEVTNNGLSTAAAPVVVSDALSEEFAFESFGATSGWECEHDGAAVGGLMTCTLGTVATPLDLIPAPTGVASPIEVVVTVEPLAGPATVTNRASVGSLTPDPDLTNNTAEDPVVIVDVADVTVVKSTTGDDPVTAGEASEFTIQASNAGPSAADAVTVRDELPAGLTVDSITAADPWTCAGVGTGVLACRYGGSLEPGDAPPIVVGVAVSSAVADGTTLTNVATIATSTPQGQNVLPDTDSSTLEVSAVADLSLAKSLVEPTGPCAPAACAGEQVAFDLEVGNAGPSDAAPDVTVTDTLPSGLVPVAASGTGDEYDWVCDIDGQDVSCILFSLDTAAAATLPAGVDAPVLRVAADSDPALEPTTLTNPAAVSSPTTDPDPGTNDDTADVDIEPFVDLGITKTHEGPVRIGDRLTFTVEVTNAGPSVATAVTVDDLLPPGLTEPVAEGVDAADWSCDVQAPTDEGTALACALGGPLEPGAVSAFTVTVLVSPEAFPQATNTATVATETPESTDPDELPDSATDVVDVPPQVDLSIVKDVDGDVVVGGTGRFVLTVANAGPTLDPGPVTVTDRLPDGLVPTRASGPGWSCDIAGQRVTCVDNDGLDVDETTRITVVTDVGAAAAPSATNRAAVTSPAEDLDESNNSDSVDVAVTVPPGPPPVGPGGQTPTTGGAPVGALWLAGLLVLAGGGLLAASRRRAVPGQAAG